MAPEESQPSARPLTTRSLTASADPARRLQELLREEAPAVEAAPEALPPATPPPVPPAPPPVEPFRLVVMLDGTRLEAEDYSGREALPTRLQLEQSHRAYILRDHWSKADATSTWTVYMKRKTR